MYLKFLWIRLIWTRQEHSHNSITYLECRVEKITEKKKKKTGSFYGLSKLELDNSLIKEFNISRELKDTNMGFAISIFFFYIKKAT